MSRFYAAWVRRMSDGRPLLSLSGIDGVGKSSQVRALVDAYNKDGAYAIDICDLQRSNTDWTSADLQQLTRRLEDYDVIGMRQYAPSTASTVALTQLKYRTALNDPRRIELSQEAARLAAADINRWLCYLVAPLVNSGRTLLFDRYAYDEIAYRIWHGLRPEQADRYFAGALSPRLRLRLDLHAKTLYERNLSREDGRSVLFTNPSALADLTGHFAVVADRYELTPVDANCSSQELTARILKLMQPRSQ